MNNGADRRAGDRPQVGTDDPSPHEAPTQTFHPGAHDAPVLAAGSSLNPGQLFGHYHILRLLGRGGMGAVYEAEDLDNGRRVGLKTSRRAPENETDHARFLREGRLAASISHPNTLYVFGTEEIDGIPVIVSELATGGTLSDRVAVGGPLAPAQAVDAMLEVIAGLEAAAAAGVLHRDVKPSNCFVDSEGRIKVGDFGLSISTLTRDETRLTRIGALLGTPAFASPEQLRGEPLDVRSDIYAVGATLYYLLAGREPFVDDHAVRLITRVLQDAPAPLRTVGRDVPRGLEKIVLWCLAKQPVDRPRSYAQLRTLLHPYGSTSPTPATLGLRLLAGCVDSVIMALIYQPLLPWAQWSSTDRFGTLASRLAGALLFIGYFGLWEGLGSASPGKWLVRLRVVSANRQPIGLGRSFARAVLLYVLSGLPPALVSIAFAPEIFKAIVAASATGNYALIAGNVVALLGLCILFATARRSNGFAGVHDLVTDTRVVSKLAIEPPSIADALLAVAPVIAPSSARIGPYVLLEESLVPAGVIVGFDERLVRKVWIRRLAPGTPPVSAARRDLRRPTRLRWLTGRRDADLSWDAYEAVDGEPLRVASRHPRCWSTVRRWLLDLAHEITAASEEGEDLPLALDRVWIAGDRVRLLDWNTESSESKAAVPARAGNTGPAGWQEFMSGVATLGLGIDGHASTHTIALPLHARDFLAHLATARFRSPADAVARLQSDEGRPAALTHARRGAHLAVCAAAPVMWLLIFVSGAQIAGPWRAQTPEYFVVERCLQRLEQLDRSAPTPDTARERSTIEVYLVGRFGTTLVEQPGAAKPWFWPSIEARGPIVRRALERHPNPSHGEVGQATQQLASLLTEARRDHERAARGLLPWPLVLLISIGGLAVVAAAGLVSALVTRGGTMMRLLGIAVIGPDGREVSRLRSFVRALAAWTPAMAAFVLMVPAVRRGHLDDVGIERVAPTLVLLSVLVAGALVGLLFPQRGLQDLLARTRLVTR